MKFSEFLQKQMSEPDGTPSNNRVMLFLFLTAITGILIGTAISPNLTVKISIPVIPDSFANFVEWVAGILVGGSAVGKAANAYATKGTGNGISNSN